MSKSIRPWSARTHDGQKIQQYTLWPEQQAYELLRPVVLFNESAAERARETHSAERTLQRKAEQFEQHGMASLFPKEPASPSDSSRGLPPDMRQWIVDLKAEYPAFRPHEIAPVCYVRFGRRPSHHSVQRVLASSPRPSLTGRRFPPSGEIADGYERRRTVIWRVPSYAPRSSRQLSSKVTQLALFEILVHEKAAGAEAASPFLRLVIAPPSKDEDS